MPSPFDTALALAPLGIRWTPLRARGKIPTVDSWQRRGVVIPTEWVMEPAGPQNIGIITGHGREGLALGVVDTDEDYQEEWCGANLPPTPWMVKTRRGFHRYYRIPKGVRVVSAPRHFPDGRKACDVKGEGGQVVGPWSVHASGHVYTPTFWPWTSQHIGLLPDFPQNVLGEVAADQEPVSDGWEPSYPINWYRAGHALAERWLRKIVDPYYDGRGQWIARAKHDSETVCFRVALAVRRGHLLATAERWRAAVLAGAETLSYDADDADEAAIDLIMSIWNPHCVASDGRTPYPWTRREIAHKVRDAGRSPYVEPLKPMTKYIEQFNTAYKRGDVGVAMLRQGRSMYDISRLPVIF